MPYSEESNPLAFALARSGSIFRHLPDEAIERLFSCGQQVVFEPGQLLIRQGESSDCAYLVLDGTVEVLVQTDHGEVILATLGAGALFGEIGALAGVVRSATVRANGRLRALRLKRTDLLETGEANPRLLLSVIGHLGEQITRFNNAMALYTSAVAALEAGNFDVSILDELRQPTAELMDFAVHFRRMAEQIILRRAQEAEMASAAAIQRAMLPTSVPKNLIGSPFDVHMHILPAKQVGGDLYDLVELDDDHVAVTIGDVCGKGVPASLFMAVTQTITRLVIRSGVNLKVEVEKANRLLVAQNKENLFTTWFCAVLNVRSGAVMYCNCGHNPPLLLRRGTGEIETLPNCGPPLGIMEEIAYTPRSVQLDPEDLLLLYTDGITEAENPTAEQFGSGRLRQVLMATEGQPAHAVIGEVAAAVTRFVDGAAQSDDITCLVIRRLAD